MNTQTNEQAAETISKDIRDYVGKVITGRIWSGNGVVAETTGILHGPFSGTYVIRIADGSASMYMPENPKCIRVGNNACFDRWV